MSRAIYEQIINDPASSPAERAAATEKLQELRKGVHLSGQSQVTEYREAAGQLAAYLTTKAYNSDYEPGYVLRPLAQQLAADFLAPVPATDQVWKTYDDARDTLGRMRSLYEAAESELLRGKALWVIRGVGQYCRYNLSRIPTADERVPVFQEILRDVESYLADKSAPAEPETLYDICLRFAASKTA